MAALLGGPLAGHLLDMEYGGESSGSRFLPLFWLFTVLRLISSLLILNLDLKFKKKSSGNIRDFIQFIMDPRILYFLLTSCFLGSIWGFLETYFFFFLDQLGASKTDMGLTLSVGTLAGFWN